jgi:hypothetical protein
MSAAVAGLNAASEDEFVRRVGPVYENSPHFVRRAGAHRSFADAYQLRGSAN